MYSRAIAYNYSASLYPEKKDGPERWSDRMVDAFGARLAPWVRPGVKHFEWIVAGVNSHTAEIEGLGKKDLLSFSRHLGQQIRRGGFTRTLVAKSFALVRHAAEITIGLRPFDVQLLGGVVLLAKMVAEMETGEGKTLVAILPAVTLALAGIPVHIITVNDYLARRDAEWMGPLYRSLGLSVGTIVHGMDLASRQKAYQCSVTYCTNKEVAFDYLRDRMVLWERPGSVRMKLERLYGETSRLRNLAMRGLHFAIVDEADSVLVDEARTPLIISSEADGSFPPEVYAVAIGIAETLRAPQDFELTNERQVNLTPRGKRLIGEIPWEDPLPRLSTDQREGIIKQALTALHLFECGRDYLIKDERIQIVDEYSGRLMGDRSWEQGLHQLIEVKERCKTTLQKDPRARISYQRFFRRYVGLAGMTGTAREVAGELWSTYRLGVVTIPTNRPVRRVGLPDRIYATAEKKWQAVVDTIARRCHEGRPVLVGTRSVGASEHLSRLLDEAGVPYRLLNARQDEEEAAIIAGAGQKSQVTVATNMAGRGTDIKLGECVADLGGLHVIATERHDARRIDRQLYGRCGRQGDPGSFEAIVCLEDELIKLYSGRFQRWLGKRLLALTRGPLGKLVCRWIFYRAQRSAEALHARMRRDLRRMDEHISASLAFSGRLE